MAMCDVCTHKKACMEHPEEFQTCAIAFSNTLHRTARKTASALSEQVAGSHYRTMPIQPIEFCHKNNLGPCETLAIKYICRHKAKNGAQDIKKAIHVMQLLLELEYKEEK